ncbi:3-deoxy-D-manno-octulosonate 8-phosphate phosphatase (KDO 8-P phosphatase) [Pseudoalteromonas nigrifaciens]|uniref:3-deoxy-D-manno-octulosonate 8-phosphate phosphatase KdsC n=1 Tax=Pseudoalteromonas nigrifaciens TaxID=28109 RepID=A0AAC9UFN7_9GAMM|nr:HAD-IIIA family hydrolase [Pseudoalteromonas nigrifaciens]ASM52814.1 3-deoxy-D-manno-octulosonate 8-phosphate phosphatase (KDO 8-P phosphatase) [Pseudoalteromonas nigrifaciens]GEN43172.1 3-deoxy-manno-octulosonate-8-phosphatase [Pseudoalteromonas nigrifaciens]SUC53309.1 3-deoxy-D-manno-octulosonate 8-phosphate phosphatas KdsC [Pseudoalteromonas nigrifaciens]
MKLKSLNTNIRLVIFDVDGVMTDGSIFISEHGEEVKSFNAKDGIAIELLRSHNILSGVISGKASKALNKRCEQLAFDIVVTGCKNKLPKLVAICRQYNVSLDEVAFCGDDILDLPIMNTCGLSAAPADAHSLVLNSADWVMSKNGGFGMVREFVDTLLEKQLKKPLIEIYVPLMNKVTENYIDGIEQ